MGSLTKKLLAQSEMRINAPYALVNEYTHKRDDNLVVFAGNSLHNPQHVRLAVRNAERAEDRLGLFFPTLIQCLNDVADRWIFGVPHVLK
jgi:hypothetical protein